MIRTTAVMVNSDDDREQRHAVLQRARRVLQGDEGRHEQRDRHEHDATGGRGLWSIAGRLGEGSHRRVQRHRARRHERQCVGEVEEPARNVDQVGVGEHVERVAREHARHGPKQEPVRRDTVLFGAEGDPHGHHHQEDRHRRIARQHEPDRQWRVVVEQHRVDDVDPGHRQDGQSGDHGVEDDPEVPLPSAVTRPREPEQSRRSERVAGEREQVGNQGTTGGDVAQRVEVDAQRATDEEERHRRRDRPPRPGERGSMDADEATRATRVQMPTTNTAVDSKEPSSPVMANAISTSPPVRNHAQGGSCPGQDGSRLDPRSVARGRCPLLISL